MAASTRSDNSNLQVLSRMKIKRKPEAKAEGDNNTFVSQAAMRLKELLNIRLIEIMPAYEYVEYVNKEYKKTDNKLEEMILLAMKYYRYFLVNKNEELAEFIKMAKLVHGYETNPEIKEQLMKSREQISISSSDPMVEMDFAKKKSAQLRQIARSTNNFDLLKIALYFYPETRAFREVSDAFFATQATAEVERLVNIPMSAQLFALSQLLERFVEKNIAVTATAYLRLGKDKSLFSATEIAACETILANVESYKDFQKEMGVPIAVEKKAEKRVTFKP